MLLLLLQLTVRVVISTMLLYHSQKRLSCCDPKYDTYMYVEMVLYAGVRISYVQHVHSTPHNLVTSGNPTKRITVEGPRAHRVQDFGHTAKPEA